MIEDDVRTMLRRRAEDITVTPRPWAELDAASTEELRPAPSSRRWLAVAALILAVGVAATVLVGRDAETDDSSDVAVPVQQVPGQHRPFDPATAPPVSPAPALLVDPGASDPIEAATIYLGDRVRTPVVVGPAATDVETGLSTVPWGIAGDELAGGTVYLRRMEAKWMVVGAANASVSFSDLSLDEIALRFSVQPLPGLEVTADVDGRSLRATEFAPGRYQLMLGQPLAPPTVRVQQGRSKLTEFVVQPDGGPAGGRLVTSGKVGNKTWRIWATDRADGTDETPCVVLTVVSRTVAGPVCGIGPGDPSDRSYFSQIGPVAEELEWVLLFGVVDAEVDTVDVMHVPDDGQQVRALPDPLHPDGARVFAAAVPVVEPTVQVGFSHGGQPLGDPIEVQVDGPVGG